jgi:hypothetical protein
MANQDDSQKLDDGTVLASFDRAAHDLEQAALGLRARALCTLQIKDDEIKTLRQALAVSHSVATASAHIKPATCARVSHAALCLVCHVGQCMRPDGRLPRDVWHKSNAL